MTENPVSPARRILDAAGEVFAAEGFGGARIDQIARVARVNKASVYYHVGDKDQLYARVIGEVADGVTESLDLALTDVVEPEERFRIALATIARTVDEHPHFAPLLLREVASGGASLPDEVLQKIARVFRAMGDILRDGAARGAFHEQDPVVTHMLIAGGMLFLIAGTPIRERIRKILHVGNEAFAEPSLAEIPPRVAELILHGLSRKRQPEDDDGTR